MNKKIVMFLAGVFMMLAQITVAQPMGISFHLFGSNSNNYSDETLYNFVCEINKYYNDYSQTGIQFYLHSVQRRPSASPTSPGSAVAASPKVGPHIDVYHIGQPPVYNNQFQAIFVNGFSGLVLAHEIGHNLGLLHPVGANGTVHCACNNSGDPDCCPDTYPGSLVQGGWSDNIMMSGPSTISYFTPDQVSRIQSCMRQYWSFSPLNALALNYRNIVPVEYLTGNPNGEIAEISWTYPSSSGCGGLGLPVSVDIEIITACPDGSKEHKFFYSFPNVTSAFFINSAYGIQSITYTYYYSNGMKNTITKLYNVAPAPWALCSLGDDDPVFKQGKPTSVNSLSENSALFQLINNPVNSNLRVDNIGFEKLAIYDIAGRKYKELSISNGQVNVDISELPAGVYIAVASSSSLVQRERFVKR